MYLTNEYERFEMFREVRRIKSDFSICIYSVYETVY